MLVSFPIKSLHLGGDFLRSNSLFTTKIHDLLNERTNNNFRNCKISYHTYNAFGRKKLLITMKAKPADLK